MNRFGNNLRVGWNIAEDLNGRNSPPKGDYPVTFKVGNKVLSSAVLRWE